MVTCDACGKEIGQNEEDWQWRCNRVRVGKVDLTLCYYCSHDIHEQFSLGCLWVRVPKPNDEVWVTKNMLGEDVYGSATVFDGGKMIFHQE